MGDIDLEDYSFDSESEDGGGKHEDSKRPVHDLAQIISEEAGTDFPFTTEHVLLCRLISLYGRCALKPGERETWVRSTPLNVLIYECISAGVLDFDYAPVLQDISYRGESKKVWLNFSQEAMAALDDLRLTGMIRTVRMYTEDYKPSMGFQVSLAGLAMMKAVPQALFDELRHVVYVPDDTNSYKDMVQVSWNPDKDLFALKSDKTGYYRYSTITEVEDVSYVCSPYVPIMLRRGLEPCTNNRARAMEAFAGMTNIKDGDLMEAITLGEVRYLLVEWVPFGENSIAHMCTNMGAIDRNHEGMFSSVMDNDPSSLILNVPAGLTHVRILDSDVMHHINVEAEINYPEEEGIVQVEFFGIHISTQGNVLFGLAVDSIMTKRADNVSIDLLTRMAVDVVQDSSTILDDMMTAYQREQLDALYQGHAAVRRKYCAYVCASIEPYFATSAQYLDGQDHENEIAQIIGQVRLGKDLTQQHFLFIGTIGMLLVGPRAHEYDSFIVPFCNLQAMMLVAGTVFERFNHIFQMLDEAMNLTYDIETTPYNVGRIQFLMARATSEINILDLIISQLEEGVEKALMPPEPRNEVGIRIYSALECRNMQKSVLARVKALKNLMTDAQRKTGYIRRYTDLVNKHALTHSVRRTDAFTHQLVQATKITTLKTRNTWVAQSILGILFMIRLGSQYRTGVHFCNMLPMIKEVAVELTETFFLYNFYERPDRIYSEVCPWVNPWQRWHLDNPYLLMAFVTGIALGAWILVDAISFFIQKRRSKVIQNSQMGWRAGHGTERLGRICHRLEALLPFDEDKLDVYLKGKKIKAERFRRDVLPGIRVNGHKEADQYCTLLFLQWVETDSKAWKGLPPTISLVFEQEIGFIRSIKFDVNKRTNGLSIDESWAILCERWVAAGVVKREHCTPEAMQANDGKWAQVDVEARKAAAIAADIAVAEANGGGAAMSKKEREKVHRKLQEEAKQKIVQEYKASKKYHGEMKKIEKILLDRKGLGRKVAAEWKEDYRHWKDVQKLGAAERRQFHKAAKKRVIQRLMRPTLLDTALAALKRFFAKRGKSKGSGKQGVTRVVDDETDLEAGKGEGNEEEDAEVDEDDQRVDVDDEDEYGGNRVPKNRASSSRGSKGLSEAETEAPPNPAPQDSDDD